MIRKKAAAKSYKPDKQALETGWFGRAAEKGHRAARSRYVHLYNRSIGACLCGYRPHKTMHFQFNAAYVELNYVDCPKCRKAYGA